MIEVKKLFDTLNNTDLIRAQKFPELFRSNEGDVRILYAGALLNKAGIFRSAIPKLELDSKGFSTILANFLREKHFNDSVYIDNYNLGLKHDIIAWADYIILPTLSQDISFLVNDLKRANKNITVCFDLDKNYHKLPNKSNDFVYYDLHKQKAILNNISKCDLLIVPDASIMEFYDKELKKYHDNSNIEVAIVPNFISEKQFKLVLDALGDNPPKRDENIFTVLVHAEVSDYNDVNANRDIFEFLQKTYPQVKIIVFGENLNWKDVHALRGIRHEFVKAKNHFDYYTQLARINPNVAFIPISHRNDYYRTNHKFLELSALGIPIITYNVAPYSQYKDIVLMEDKKRGIKDIFADILKDKSKLAEMGAKASDFVWKNYSLNSSNMEIFTNSFYANVNSAKT
jgi:hypothetical protein